MKAEKGTKIRKNKLNKSLSNWINNLLHDRKLDKCKISYLEKQICFYEDNYKPMKKNIKIALAKQLKDEYGYKDSLIIEATSIPESTYYSQYKRIDIKQKYQLACEALKEIYPKFNGAIGRRLATSILDSVYDISLAEKTVAKLMSVLNLKYKKSKKLFITYEGEEGKIKNILNREFNAEKPNEKWSTDITEILLPFGKCYLCPFIDLFNREIVAYCLSTSCSFEIVKKPLLEAIKRVGTTNGLIISSDQGWHYKEEEYIKLLKENNITQSMSGKGVPYDNSVIERFFKTFKTELVYGNEKNFYDFNSFKEKVDDYINFYNTIRPRLETNMSPVKQRIIWEKNNSAKK